MHEQLVEHARKHLVKIGAKNIRVLDGIHTGRKSPYKKPIPDIVATLNGKKVAVECGYLAGRRTRFAELRAAGYQIILHFPYLEYFDSSMTAFAPWFVPAYKDKPAV